MIPWMQKSMFLVIPMEGGGKLKIFLFFSIQEESKSRQVYVNKIWKMITLKIEFNLSKTLIKGNSRNSF